MNKPRRWDTRPERFRNPQPATLDADTLRDLRNLVARATPGPWPLPLEMPHGHVLINGPGYLTIGSLSRLTDAALIVALVNAAPALLDAAEAAERARILATSREVPGWEDEPTISAPQLRAALATPPDPLAYTTHDDYDDEPPEYTRDEEAQR